MACGAFDAHRRFRELTVHILGDTLLGVDTAGDESVVMAAADAVVDRSDPRRLGQLLPDVIPTPTDRRLARRLRELDAYVDALLEDASADGNDVRSVLVGAHEEGGLTRAEVRDNLVAVLLAGHDSSAAALTYLWYELTRHPSVLGRIREEVTEVVGDR
ncbi:MAG: cytochrome P450, partial [Halobacteriales archaeon]